jgi:sterol desaturase/sphingolipid hydroxylase (fatty acid hydroxylase superfamily)
MRAAIGIPHQLGVGLEFIERILDSIARNAAAESYFYVMLAVSLSSGLAVDIHRKRNLHGRYFSGGFRIDAIYAVFELGHFWHLLVLVPLATAVSAILSLYLRVEGLTLLPVCAQVLATLVVTDFCNYWYHRAQHRNRWLWQFHKVHHSQQQLTSLTTFRQSILTRIVTLLFLSIPAAVMGAGAAIPLAVVMIQLFHQTMEHTNTGWTYGPIGRLIVSPAYHEVHHSNAPEHLNRNLSPVFTIWDRLFDTYAERGRYELEFGLTDEVLPESYVAQLFAPATGIYRLLREQGRSRREPVAP